MDSVIPHQQISVYIAGSLSSLLPLEAGVSQGSILGPIFYTIFTNELPEIVHEHADNGTPDVSGVWPA